LQACVAPKEIALPREPYPYQIEFNCIARGRVRVGVWENVIPKSSTWEDLRAMARKCLLIWWPERDGELSPIVEPNELRPIPDEVVINSHDGLMICRYNLVDELNARYEMLYG
jgi:hypothetical protein